MGQASIIRNVIFNPFYRRVQALVAVAVIAFFIGIEYYLRGFLSKSLLAPTPETLWMGLGLGCLAGLVPVVSEWILRLVTRQHDSRKTRWKRVGVGLFNYVLLLLPMPLLCLWCFFNSVFVIVPLLAAYAIVFMQNGSEVRQIWDRYESVPTVYPPKRA